MGGGELKTQNYELKTNPREEGRKFLIPNSSFLIRHSVSSDFEMEDE